MDPPCFFLPLSPCPISVPSLLYFLCSPPTFLSLCSSFLWTALLLFSFSFFQHFSLLPSPSEVTHSFIPRFCIHRLNTLVEVRAVLPVLFRSEDHLIFFINLVIIFYYYIYFFLFWYCWSLLFIFLKNSVLTQKSLTALGKASFAWFYIFDHSWNTNEPN